MLLALRDLYFIYPYLDLLGDRLGARSSRPASWAVGAISHDGAYVGAVVFRKGPIASSQTSRRGAGILGTLTAGGFSFPAELGLPDHCAIMH